MKDYLKAPLNELAADFKIRKMLYGPNKGKLHFSPPKGMSNENAMDIVNARKPDLHTYLDKVIEAEALAAKKAAAKQEDRINRIPGLQLLRKALDENEDYYYTKKKFIENDMLGKPPTKPASDPK